MRQVFEDSSLEWQSVRPEVPHGIFGRTLFAGDNGVLARVAPGDDFRAHRDKYGQSFYFLSPPDK